MSPAIAIRERAPLRLHASVKTPTGAIYRWGQDEDNPVNVFGDLTFSTTMPGGFEQCSMTLPRRTDFDYADLAEFSTVTLMGLGGGATAWEGRLERTPRTSGDHVQISPGLVGWQAHLDDDKTARMIYVDRDMSRWGGPTLSRQIDMNNNSADVDGPSTTSDALLPAVTTQFAGDWGRAHWSEAWYDARGLQLNYLCFAWQRQIVDNSDSHWQWAALISSDDRATANDNSGNLRAAGPSTGIVPAVGVAPGGVRKWAAVQVTYDQAGGAPGTNYGIQWTYLATYGNHFLPVRGSQPYGFYASDIVGHAVSTWAPKLSMSRAGMSTIQPSTFIIPHLTFLDATTASEIIRQASRFDLQEWAVWEGPTFYWASQGTYGRNWRARVGPAQLQENGPQVDRLWNGVVVQYSDTTGVSRTVGPTGSGANFEYASLLDTDPSNPVNVAGMKRWNVLQMGTAGANPDTGFPDAAAKIGQMFLAMQKQLSTSGEAVLVGHVEDDHGVLWPAWTVRSGDTITFVDAHDPVPRRIVRTEYDDSTKSCHVSLDSPPEGLQAYLERLSVSIMPLGFQ